MLRRLPGCSGRRWRAADGPRRYATLLPRRECLRTNRTRTPRRASMSMSASVLKRSILPRRRSLIRGWETRRILAASACLKPRELMSFWSWMSKSARIKRCSTSSGGKPRSRNTFPVDAVTLSFALTFRLPAMLASTSQDQGSKSLPGELHFPEGRFSRPLLERVEHVDPLRELGDVKDTMFASCVDSNLLGAWTDARHGLPIIRLHASLQPPQLEAGYPACIGRKRLQGFSNRCDPDERLVRHGGAYKY